MESEHIEGEFAAFAEAFRRLKSEIQRAIVGYDGLITDVLTAMFCQGHVLLEGVPGLGKTYLVQVISRVMGLEPGRVQCTPDLMPADILGTQIVDEDEHGRKTFHFEKGPVFRNLLLVDEINRATPKTQAALLEVMQECAVTSGGQTHRLPSPFFVLATQNPMEMEGTYPLPEAQLDRFLFKVRVPFPDRESLVEISRRTTGPAEAALETIVHAADVLRFQRVVSEVGAADPVTAYGADLVLATHPGSDLAGNEVQRYVAYGASPRGLQALVRGARVRALLDGRAAAAFEDVRDVALAALRHRVILNFEGEAEGIDVDVLLRRLIDNLPEAGEGRLAAATQACLAAQGTTVDSCDRVHSRVP
jgi:MoxR-like ATPase